MIESVKHFMEGDAMVQFFAKALKCTCPTGYRGAMRVREQEIREVMKLVL